MDCIFETGDQLKSHCALDMVLLEEEKTVQDITMT